MLAYKENIKLESNKLVIELPDIFIGKEFEISIVENHLKNLKDDKMSKFKRMMTPYENELLNNGSTYRREDIYD